MMTCSHYWMRPLSLSTISLYKPHFRPLLVAFQPKLHHFSIFFYQKWWLFEEFCVILLPTKPVQAVGGQPLEFYSLATERNARMADDCEGRAGQNKHRWNPEAENTVCKDSRRERTFSERYLSVNSNFATLNLLTVVMQRSVRVGVLYPMIRCSYYIIRCNVELYL